MLNVSDWSSTANVCFEGPSWPWSYGSWINNYICNQCLSPLMLWVRIPIRARCTKLCDKVCQWLATGRWFPPISSTNKIDLHDITAILLKVALNTIKQTNIMYVLKINKICKEQFLLEFYMYVHCLGEPDQINYFYFYFIFSKIFRL